MNKVLTVSIAAYNVSNYLDRALQSLISSGETLDKLDVIIVDDGSKDNTAEIAARYQTLYPNSITVINKENGGYGSTINTSIRVARGKFFKLLDGDDWFDGEGLSQFVRFLEQSETDVVFTKYALHYEPELKREKIVEQSYPYDVVLPIESVNRQCMHAFAVKTELIRDVSIQENCFYTDAEFFIKAVSKAEQFVSIDCLVYCYRLGRNEQSVSYNSLIKHKLDRDYIVKNCSTMVFSSQKLSGMRNERRKYLFSHLVFLVLIPHNQENREMYYSLCAFLKENRAILKKMNPVAKICALFPKISYRVFYPLFKLAKRQSN